MSRPRIGITTYGRNEQDRFTLPVQYVEAVRRAGGLPTLLPPGGSDAAAWLDQLDGVLLAGGGDLAPAAYGGRDHDSIYNLDAERDTTELEVARVTLERELPCLCICRGLQVMNVALGGTLIEHLPDEVGEQVVHRGPERSPVRHPVTVDEGSRLAGLLGATQVNPFSLHHQAIRDVAPGLQVVARAADGVIEAVENPERPWLLAVQWHPELSADTEESQQRLFDVLVRLARG